MDRCAERMKCPGFSGIYNHNYVTARVWRKESWSESEVWSLIIIIMNT